MSIHEDDYYWPHLHMRCPEGIFKIRFADLRVTTQRGSQIKARKDIAEVKAWMNQHKEELAERWAQRERGEKITPIN